MAEGNEAVVVAQQTPANGGGGATPAATPQGRTISDAEYATYQRYEQQIKGQQPLIDAAMKLGFKTPDDFAPLGKIRERGIDFRRLSDTFDQPEPKDEPETPDFNKLLDEREAKWRRELAEREHRTGNEASLKRLEQEAVKLAGPDASEYDKELLKHALRDKYWELAQDYEDGHPLKGAFVRPLDDAGFTKLADWVTSAKAKAKGANLNKIAEAAGKPAPKSTAGNNTEQGKPSTGSGDSRADYKNKTRDTVAKMLAD